jgi:DNA repair protein RecN (Recombination protein N)
MLKQLHIQNLAIIDELDLDLNQGLTVLTGETGAGKSILIDAVGLILGDRGDLSVIREGCARSEIIASFDVTNLIAIKPILEHQSIPIEDNEIIIRRIINRDGRSRAYINRSQIPIQLLKTIGEVLIDIHGQHAHQSLMKRSVQRSLLDYFADHGLLLDEVNNSFEEWKIINKQLSDIGTNGISHASSVDLLEYQVKELQELKPAEDEYDQLEEEFRRLSNITELINISHSVLEMLSDHELSAESNLQRAIHELRDLQKSDSSTQKFVESLDSISIQLTDTVDELRHYSEKLEINPDRLSEVDNRLNTLQNLARKHHVHARDLPAHLQQLQDELEQVIRNRDSVDKLVTLQTAASESYKVAADKLHRSRIKSSKLMAHEITEQLKQLGMPGGKLVIEIIGQEFEQPLENGLDQVEFLVSLNPGSSPQPMRKVASGGELSRISLAIQMISRDTKTIPTLIFDEVDSGIGGRTADIVGNLLKQLAMNYQVLCVTHLPQVASRGDNHLQVSKFSKDNLTYTKVSLLDEHARVEEVARMLGGMRISEKTREHAKEMLDQEPLVTTR